MQWKCGELEIKLWVDVHKRHGERQVAMADKFTRKNAVWWGPEAPFKLSGTRITASNHGVLQNFA